MITLLSLLSLMLVTGDDYVVFGVSVSVVIFANAIVVVAIVVAYACSWQ